MRIFLVVAVSIVFIAKHSHNSFAEEMPELMKNHSCVIGDNEKNCVPGSGSSRFEQRNVSDYDCMSVYKFLHEQDTRNAEFQEGGQGRTISTENKILACASYFEWRYPKTNDQDTPTITAQYYESHFCFHDTLETIKEVTKNSPDGCNTVASTNSGTTRLETTCVCFDEKGQHCNMKFKANFKNEPEQAQSLCGSNDLEIDNPVTQDTSKTSHNLISIVCLIVTATRSIMQFILAI